jgi:DNA-directed RNA polymerase subunit RPC12/RpoP
MKERFGVFGCFAICLFIFFSLFLIPIGLQYSSSGLRNIAIILILLWVVILAIGILLIIIRILRNTIESIRYSRINNQYKNKYSELREMHKLRCSKCMKTLIDTYTTDGMQSPKEKIKYFSELAKVSYPCKSCGELFCRDCGNKIIQSGGKCPLCNGKIG